MAEYRQFQPDDAEQCRTLILSCIDDFEGVGPGGHEKFRRKTRNCPYRKYLASMFCIVATDCDDIVGMGALDGETIKRMYVSPQRRGEGIGKAIYEKLEAEARRRGLQSLHLDSSMNAIGFYERMEFIRVGEKSWNLDGAIVRNIVMGKDLSLAQRERTPLYGKTEAECLEVRETMRDDHIKYDLLLEHLGPSRRLVDIGAGWGQFLALATERVEEIWAVDECPDRVKDIHKVCPKANVVICRADRLKLPDEYFDAVVTSQMLHEVKLFGKEGELAQALSEIHRVLSKGGRYLLLDHRDAGDGEVVVQLPEGQMAKLAEFEQKYQFYKAAHKSTVDKNIRITRRCLQDFLSKDWSLNSAMEEMEMNETHNVFEEKATRDLVTAADLNVRQWIGFSDITVDLDRHGGKLIEGAPWYRKFLLVAEKR